VLAVVVGLILAVLVCEGNGFAGGPIRVTDAIESGGLGTWKVEDETHLIVNPRREYDQDHLNSALTWFYGRLSNVAHREVTIDLVGLDQTVYNGKPVDILPFERNTRPVFSYDGVNWSRFTDCRFDKAAKRFRIRQIFTADPVWIAYIIPYPLSRLERFLDEIRSHPAAKVETICLTPEKRPLYVVTIPGFAEQDRSRPVVWILARQHAFETGGSWAAEGLIRFLLSDDPEALELRRKVLFKVCPMVNPDGVTDGNTRFNANGVDLNRHWNASDPLSSDPKRAPEIALLKQAIVDWSRQHRLDLFINIHNNDMVWNDQGDYISFAPPARDAEARRLEALLREQTVYTGPFDPSTGDQATEAVVAAETGSLALIMEMKTGYLESLGRWTSDDLFLEHGRGLARAILRYFEELPEGQ
jgi:hypothetical protein